MCTKYTQQVKASVSFPSVPNARYTVAAAVPMSFSIEELELEDWKRSSTGILGCSEATAEVSASATPYEPAWNMGKGTYGRYLAYTNMARIIVIVDRYLSYADVHCMLLFVRFSAFIVYAYKHGHRELHRPSQYLLKTSTASMGLLSASLFSVVIVLISLTTLPPAVEPDHKFQYWWAIHKWIILSASALAVLGVIVAILMMNYVVTLKFPDPNRRVNAHIYVERGERAREREEEKGERARARANVVL